MGSLDRSTDAGPVAPLGLALGIVGAVVVVAAAWLAMGTAAGIVVLVLAAICVGVFFAYRTVGTSARAEEDARDSVPRLSTEEARPLGDTPEAHDEINPHDLPPDHPGRRTAEEMAADESEPSETERGEGLTAGMEEGGAAGEEGPEEGDTDEVQPGEPHERAARD